jgi:CheY-like chemotaxis protein
MKSQPADPPKILLIDDNAGDIRLITEALGACVPGAVVASISDSTLVIPFLKRAVAATDTPNLVLLDLRMPKKTGLQVLEEIKSDPELGFLPVVILTSSEAQQDIFRAYALHASSVVTKPLSYAHLRAAMKTLCEFWLETAHLPEARHARESKP